MKTRKSTNLLFLRDNILALQLQLMLLDQLWHLVRCVGGRRYFPYYSYCRNPTGREFFVPAGTLIAEVMRKKTFVLRPKIYRHDGVVPF